MFMNKKKKRSCFVTLKLTLFNLQKILALLRVYKENIEKKLFFY